MSEAADTFVRLELDRDEALGLLRALAHAQSHVIDSAMPAEYRTAQAEADQYETVRNRLLEEVARRDVPAELPDEA